MKYYLVIAILISLPVSTWAQQVIRVKAKEATIELPAKHSYAEGDKLNFLSESLEVVGSGQITKLSPNKSKALVNIENGSVKVGNAFESEKPAKLKEIKDTALLSERDREILEIGEISQSSYIIGGVLGTYPLGFGIGHAIQGRYLQKGYIFTIGEAVSLALMISKFGDCIGDSLNDEDDDCDDDGLFAIGVAGFVGFRIWEIIDVWAAPPGHNRRYRQLQKEGYANRFKGFVVPVNDGALAGLAYQF